MKLLVNAPSGRQEIIDVSQSGGYFDPSRVLWDERIDGPMPELSLGGMVRSGNDLLVDQAILAAADASALEEKKQSMISEIKSKRDFMEVAGFSYLGKVIDSNERSCQRITTAAQAAQVAISLGQAFDVEWTCADNSSLLLDGPAMLGMPVALAQYGEALHTHARTLKAQVIAAANLDELAAIDINAGWPQ